MKSTELFDCINRREKELKKLETLEEDIINYSANAFTICKIAILNVKEKGFNNEVV